MENIRRTVTTTQNRGVAADGANVQQQTKEVNTQSSAESKITAQNVVWYILGLVEILLAFRFVLKLLGANSASGFVSFVYSVTGILTAPFDSVFGVARTTTGSTRSVFEPSILIAAAVYALIAWGIVRLITLNDRRA